jgi:hypothetical protein
MGDIFSVDFFNRVALLKTYENKNVNFNEALFEFDMNHDGKVDDKDVPLFEQSITFTSKEKADISNASNLRNLPSAELDKLMNNAEFLDECRQVLDYLKTEIDREEDETEKQAKMKQYNEYEASFEAFYRKSYANYPTTQTAKR